MTRYFIWFFSKWKSSRYLCQFAPFQTSLVPFHAEGQTSVLFRLGTIHTAVIIVTFLGLSSTLGTATPHNVVTNLLVLLGHSNKRKKNDNQDNLRHVQVFVLYSVWICKLKDGCGIYDSTNRKLWFEKVPKPWNLNPRYQILNATSWGFIWFLKTILYINMV